MQVQPLRLLRVGVLFYADIIPCLFLLVRLQTLGVKLEHRLFYGYSVN